MASWSKWFSLKYTAGYLIMTAACLVASSVFLAYDDSNEAALSDGGRLVSVTANAVAVLLISFALLWLAKLLSGKSERRIIGETQRSHGELKDMLMEMRDLLREMNARGRG